MESTMTTQQASSPKKLLTPAQVTQCKKIATSGDDYSSARANALLTLHQGTTQANTAVATGLSIGQVRYWVGRFRQHGMAAFPTAKSEPVNTSTEVTPTKVKPNDKKTKKSKPKNNKKKKKDDKPKKKGKDSKKTKSDKKDKKKKKSKKKK